MYYGMGKGEKKHNISVCREEASSICTLKRQGISPELTILYYAHWKKTWTLKCNQTILKYSTMKKKRSAWLLFQVMSWNFCCELRRNEKFNMRRVFIPNIFFFSGGEQKNPDWNSLLSMIHGQSFWMIRADQVAMQIMHKCIEIALRFTKQIM